MDKIPFTSYDFWGYLASGFLFLGAVDFVAGTSLLAQKDWSWFQIGLALSCAYVAGQLIASLSATLYERVLVQEVLGYPRNVLFGRVAAPKWLQGCFAAYFEPLPDATQRAALEKAKQVGVEEPGEALFWPAFNSARERSKVMERLDSFRNQYGFARNVSLVALLDALLLGWSYHFGHGGQLHGNLGLVALVVCAGMGLRYLKFFRLYAVEVFTSYAYAKEKDKDKETK